MGKNKKNPFYWDLVKLDALKVGNIISKMLSKQPVLVSSIFEQRGILAVYVKDIPSSNSFEYISTVKDHLINVLMNQKTSESATYEEVVNYV